MKVVIQEDDLGCAVACVAAILNSTYLDALQLFKDGKVKAKKSGFYCSEIVEALRNAGLNYEFRYCKPKFMDKFTIPKTIVYIKRSKLFPDGHFLVRVEEGWMDPWIYDSPNGKVAGIRQNLPEKPSYLLFKK